MSEPTLFDHPAPRARTTDPETSHEAAERSTLNAGTNRVAALRALAFVYPGALTDFELAEWTGVGQTSIGKRRLELERDGLVYRCPGKTRPSPTGSPAQLFACTERGRAVADELTRPSAT